MPKMSSSATLNESILKASHSAAFLVSDLQTAYSQVTAGYSTQDEREPLSIILEELMDDALTIKTRLERIAK